MPSVQYCTYLIFLLTHSIHTSVSNISNIKRLPRWHAGAGHDPMEMVVEQNRTVTLSLNSVLIRRVRTRDRHSFHDFSIPFSRGSCRLFK